MSAPDSTVFGGGPKAFHVQGYEYGVVVFDERHVSARRRGAEMLDEEFRDVTCRRKPEWDQYAETGIPIQVMLDAGWWFTCAGRRCDTMCETGDGSVVIEDNVYCEECARGSRT